MKEKGGVDESAKNCKGSSQIHITHIRSRAQGYQDLLSHSPSAPMLPFLVSFSVDVGCVLSISEYPASDRSPRIASLQQPYLKGKMWSLLLLQKKSSRQWPWLTWAVSQAHAKNVNILPIYKYITWKPNWVLKY